MPGATSRMTRSSLRSSLHRFGSGATASYPPRAVLTPGLASLARRERPARQPNGRAAWPDRLHAAGSRTACQEDGHPRSRLAARRAATPRRRATCRAPCRAGGRTVLLAGACGRRPLGRIAPAASEARPRRQHRPKVGYDVVRAASEAAQGGAKRRPRYTVRPTGKTGSLVALLVLGSAPLSGQSARRRSAESRVELAPPAPRHEPSTARSARRRQRATRSRPHQSVPCQRPMSGCAAIGLVLGRVARCPELGPTQRPGGRQANRIARRDEPYDAVVASLLPAPLRKRCHGVIPAKGGADAGARFARAPGAAGAPANWTSGVAGPLARSGEPNRLPGGRPSSLTSRRSTRRYPAPASHVSSPVSSGRANRPPGRRVRAPALGPVRARRERSEPRRQHRPKVGYDVVRAASEAAQGGAKRRPRHTVRPTGKTGSLVALLVSGSAPLSGQ